MNDHLVRVAHLGADGGAQAEAHGAEAAGGEQLSGIVEVEVLDGPHLMLSHVGGHNGVLGGQAADDLQHLLGGQGIAVPGNGGLPQGEDVFLPLRMAVLGQASVEQLQHPLGRAHDVVVGKHVFVDFRAVNVDLDDLGLAGKGARVQSHPVGEPAAHGDEQVALVAGQVAGLGTVHAHHAGGEGMSAGEAAAAHDGDGHRGVQLFSKLPELLVGPSPDHAAAADQHGLFRLGDHLHQSVDVTQVGLGGLQLVAGGQGPDGGAGAVLIPGDKFIVDLHIGSGDVFQKVNEHRAGTASGCHRKGLTHHIGDGVGIPDQIGGLGDGHGDAGDVHLLEGVLAQQRLRHVAGDEDDRGGVHVGGGDAGGEICGTGAAGGKAHAHLSGGAGVAVGGVGRPLFVGG